MHVLLKPLPLIFFHLHFVGHHVQSDAVPNITVSLLFLPCVVTLDLSQKILFYLRVAFYSTMGTEICGPLWRLLTFKGISTVHFVNC